MKPTTAETFRTNKPTFKKRFENPERSPKTDGWEEMGYYSIMPIIIQYYYDGAQTMEAPLSAEWPP